ncbi:MAG: hypothetical protein ACRYGK_00355 [Janthinobacterium lividum]
MSAKPQPRLRFFFARTGVAAAAALTAQPGNGCTPGLPIDSAARRAAPLPRMMITGFVLPAGEGAPVLNDMNAG